MIDRYCTFYVQSKVTATQKHVADLLCECLLIRDGLALLPRWLLKSSVQIVAR